MNSHQNIQIILNIGIKSLKKGINIIQFIKVVIIPQIKINLFIQIIFKYFSIYLSLTS